MSYSRPSAEPCRWFNLYNVTKQVWKLMGQMCNLKTTTTTTTIFICAQKLHSVAINTRDEKLQKKRAQPLRNSKANQAKWLGQAEKNLLIRLLNIEQWTRLRFTHMHTQTTIDKGMCTRKNGK